MAQPAAIQPLRGTDQEKQAYWECKQHYDMARQDLEARYPDFDRKDELFRSYIPEVDNKGQKWPYSAMVFDPRVFTAIFEKSARLLANKPRGRMEPRESGDVLGAKINTEILDFQWDDAEKVDNIPMLAKWAQLDQNARKYGASFALCKWHYEKHGDQVFFDGPNMKVWNNRDVLHNPSYSHIKNWIQLREYVTFDELKSVNDTRGKPIYKNLDVLKDSLIQALTDKGNMGRSDMRSTNWRSKNLAIKGLQDFLGRDTVNPVIEVVTEYSPDRWLTFAPTHGVILRDIPNPYKHGQIPVLLLKYYPVDEDIYGLSEIEPIEKLQKAVNASLNQYLDAINISLYPIVKVRTAAVQMHTLEWGIGKKWLMNDPSTDVVEQNSHPAGVSEFPLTYRLLVGAIQEGIGDSSAAISNLSPGEGQKTATEVRDTAVQRNVRDNFNQIFLSEAITKQMMLWFKMNQQLLFSDKAGQQKILRIAGQDAIEFFKEEGLDASGFDQQTMDQLSSPDMADIVGDPSFNPNVMATPLHPVQTQQGTFPKLMMDSNGKSGTLIIEPEDLEGTYDYIVEIKSMENPDPARVQALQQAVAEAGNPNLIQVRAQEGKYLSLVELEKDMFELLGLKDIDNFYKPLPQQPPTQDQNKVSESISFKDLPPDGQVQMAEQAGIKLDQQALMQQQLLQGGANGQSQPGSQPGGAGIPQTTGGTSPVEGFGGLPSTPTAVPAGQGAQLMG